MKFNLPRCGFLLLLMPLLAHAGPVLVVGTPGDAGLSTPSGPTPEMGGIFLNFDSLTAFSTITNSTFASQGVTISSPDGLIVDPFSTQSGPNELFDNSSDGTADVTISLAEGTSAIGIGIADADAEFDPTLSITLQPLGATGANLGAPFIVSLAATESAVNVGNGYYVVDDTTDDIFGLQITQSVSNPADFSGLAIDDLQTAPEPSTFLLLIGGAAILGSFRLRKRA